MTRCQPWFLFGVLLFWSACPGSAPLRAADGASAYSDARAFGDQGRWDAPSRDGAGRADGSKSNDAGFRDSAAGVDALVSPFTDVPITHPHFPAIQWVARQGIMFGCSPPPAAFCPDGLLSRVHLVVALITWKYGATFTYGKTPYFADVPATLPGFAFVQRAYEDGLIGGYVGGNFSPDDSAKRVDAAVVLIRGKYGATFAYGKTPYFTDVGASHYGFPFVQKLYEEKITSGCGTGLFCPDSPLPRWAWAEWLYQTKTLTP